MDDSSRDEGEGFEEAAQVMRPDGFANESSFGVPTITSQPQMGSQETTSIPVDSPLPQSPSLPPPPDRHFLGRAGKARLYVTQGGRQPFDLAVDAMVIPADAQAELGGSLALHARSVFGSSWDSFELAVRSEFGKSPLAEAPFFFLVNSPASPLRTLIATTAWTVPSGGSTLEGVERAVREVIARSKGRSIQRLAIPLLGTQDGGLTPVRVTRTILAAAGSALPEAPWIEELTVIAKEDDAFQEAVALFSRAPQQFANDLPGGNDLLDVASEIQAFTDILLLKSLQPPLAVGILGGWGSGKSFAMNLMRRHIQRIRSLPTNGGWNGQGVGQYVGHIYPIAFDAWTYAKSNLWASLMQTIFLELSRQVHLELRIREHLGESSPELEGNLWLAFQAITDRDREALLQQEGLTEKFKELSRPELQLDSDAGKALWETVTTVRKGQQKVLEEKQIKAAMVAAQIEEKRTELEKQVDEALAVKVYKIAWAGASEPLRELVLKVVKGVPGGSRAVEGGKEIKEFLELVSEDRKSLPMGFRNFWDAAKRNPVVVTMAVATAVALGGLAYRLRAYQPALAAVVAWLGPTLALLAGAARTATSWRAQVVGAWKGLEKDVQTAELRVARQREAILNERLQSSEEAKDLRALGEMHRLLESEIQRLRQQIGFSADYVSVADLVQARLKKADYEGELGLLHRVQRDLEELSQALCQSSDPIHKARLEEQFPRGPARIVLFIDDLDRCPPDRVVEVLEAVQLLVKTPLFVVVLAMDVRYITRALEKIYKDILLRRGKPSGLDYIEKIIQLPYSIRPIDATHVERFLRGQMEIQPEADANAEVPSTAQNPIAAGGASASAGASTEEPKPVSSEVVTFTLEELGWLRSCCEALPLSPRAVKRVVNALKLLKIVWFRPNRHIRPELDVQQAFVALLALSAAYPDPMRAVFSTLSEQLQAGSQLALQSELKTILSSNSVTAGCALNEIEDLRKRVDLIPIGAKVLPHLRRTLELVRSLSFVSEVGYDPADERRLGESVKIG
jgi:hypothetical protein